MESRDGKIMYSLESIQWMIGSMELCGGLHFRTMLLPSSDFMLTFFSFCCCGGTKRRRARQTHKLVGHKGAHSLQRLPESGGYCYF